MLSVPSRAAAQAQSCPPEALLMSLELTLKRIVRLLLAKARCAARALRASSWLPADHEHGRRRSSKHERRSSGGQQRKGEGVASSDSSHRARHGWLR